MPLYIYAKIVGIGLKRPIIKNKRHAKNALKER